MKRTAICAALILSCTLSFAQDIVKTGLNFGPLPAIAYDADKGFQYGAILNIFNYGDGTNYPNYDSKMYFEASFFTKGSKLLQFMYDDKNLFPGIRWSSAITAEFDKAMDFYGFNGYQSYYDWESVDAGKNGDSYIFTPFYRFSRTSVRAKSDFIGNITENLQWELGLHLSYFKTGAIDRDNINKGKKEGKEYPDNESTLFEQYVNWGLITPEEADGGFSTSLRAGLVYDTRDKEGAPSKGIWAEGHVIAAPGFLSTIGYARYSLTWRHYLPIVKNDVLTFAYRLNYEGNFGESCPFYVLPYITVMGENSDKDGMGGFRTVRGVMRDRVVGLDMATYTAEMRWRFARFHMGKQNIALGLSAFSDGSMVTRGRDMTIKSDLLRERDINSLYRNVPTDAKESMHSTVGAGFRFIMNENFIVAAEYGTPFSHLNKNSAHYNQDGSGAFYINIGYLF